TQAAQRRLAGGGFGGQFGLAPAVDGKVIPAHPFDPAAPEISAGVPMLIGTVLNERSVSIFNAKLENMTEPEALQDLTRQYHERAERIYQAFKKVHPAPQPVEIAGLAPSLRTNAIPQAARKAAQNAAPAYLYLFAWQTPVLDGRPRAFHCSELAFVFDNTD